MVLTSSIDFVSPEYEIGMTHAPRDAASTATGEHPAHAAPPHPTPTGVPQEVGAAMPASRSASHAPICGLAVPIALSWVPPGTITCATGSRRAHSCLAQLLGPGRDRDDVGRPLDEQNRRRAPSVTGIVRDRDRSGRLRDPRVVA